MGRILETNTQDLIDQSNFSSPDFIEVAASNLYQLTKELEKPVALESLRSIIALAGRYRIIANQKLEHDADDTNLNAVKRVSDEIRDSALMQAFTHRDRFGIHITRLPETLKREEYLVFKMPGFSKTPYQVQAPLARLASAAENPTEFLRQVGTLGITDRTFRANVKFSMRVRRG